MTALLQIWGFTVVPAGKGGRDYPCQIPIFAQVFVASDVNNLYA
jgi:hypothetical protein